MYVYLEVFSHHKQTVDNCANEWMQQDITLMPRDEKGVMYLMMHILVSSKEQYPFLVRYV